MNTLVVAATRKGKSTTVFEKDFKPTYDAADSAIFIIDPHTSFGEWCAQYGIHYSPERILPEYLGNLDFVSSFGFIKPSRHSSSIVREAENREMAAAFAEILTMQRSTRIEQTPLIKEWLMASLMLWLTQKEDKPLSMLPWAFRKSKQLKQLLDGSTDQEIVHKFGLIESHNSQAKLYETVGPAARLIDETFNETTFKLRTEPTLDLLDFTKKKGCYALMGGGKLVSENSFRVIARSLTFALIRQAKQHWDETRTPLKAKIYIDEAANYRLVGPTESSALATTLKAGLSFTLITQTPDFGDISINTNVDQNCSTKIYMGCGSRQVAKLCAENLKTALDPMKVKQYHQRQRHAGFHVAERKSTGTWESGDQHGKSENINVVQTPIYEDFTEPELMNLNEQLDLLEAELMKLPVGTAYVSTDGIVLKVHIKPAGDVWVWPGLGKAKLDELIEHYRKIGVYRETVESEPWTPQSKSAENRFGTDGR